MEPISGGENLDWVLIIRWIKGSLDISKWIDIQILEQNDTENNIEVSPYFSN